MHIGLLFFIMVLSFSTCFADSINDFDRQQVIERIKPIGQVRVDETTLPSTKSTVQPTKALSENEEAGQAIYEKYCIVCHQNGLAGAPKFRQETDWKPRMGKKIDGLITSAMKGLNAMPPKGTCVECKEEDIKQAIQYMLPRS